jgi:hypothetical protein
MWFLQQPPLLCPLACAPADEAPLDLLRHRLRQPLHCLRQPLLNAPQHALNASSSTTAAATTDQTHAGNNQQQPMTGLGHYIESKYASCMKVEM